MQVGVVVLVPYDPVSDFALFLLPKFGSREISWFGVFINILRNPAIQKMRSKFSLRSITCGLEKA